MCGRCKIPPTVTLNASMLVAVYSTGARSKVALVPVPANFASILRTMVIGKSLNGAELNTTAVALSV